MKIEKSTASVTVTELENFSLEKIFDCGQCFRFDKTGEDSFEGIAFGRLLRCSQPCGSTVIFETTPEDFDSIWYHYFALDTDYEAINSSLPSDGAMSEAAKRASGIRILNQDGWETLCSFIISQNNNIPRIKKNIRALCESYGEPVYAAGSDRTVCAGYSFPDAGTIARKSSEQELSALKFGFRSKYIMSAARAVASGEISLDSIKGMSSDDACSLLCSLNGVGIKVASCTLLFGFEKYDMFPIDVWMKKVLERHYPEMYSAICSPRGGARVNSSEYVRNYFGKYAGIAQQYLFYNERYIVG